MLPGDVDVVEVTDQLWMVVQDDDTHWYLIPRERKEEWDGWVETFDDEDPRPIDGPHLLVFQNPRVL